MPVKDDPPHELFWIIHRITGGDVTKHEKIMNEVPLTWVYSYADRAIMEDLERERQTKEMKTKKR